MALEDYQLAEREQQARETIVRKDEEVWEKSKILKDKYHQVIF